MQDSKIAGAILHLASGKSFSPWNPFFIMGVLKQSHFIVTVQHFHDPILELNDMPSFNSKIRRDDALWSIEHEK